MLSPCASPRRRRSSICAALTPMSRNGKWTVVRDGVVHELTCESPHAGDREATRNRHADIVGMADRGGAQQMADEEDRIGVRRAFQDLLECRPRSLLVAGGRKTDDHGRRIGLLGHRREEARLAPGRARVLARRVADESDPPVAAPEQMARDGPAGFEVGKPHHHVDRIGAEVERLHDRGPGPTDQGDAFRRMGDARQDDAIHLVAEEDLDDLLFALHRVSVASEENPVSCRSQDVRYALQSLRMDWIRDSRNDHRDRLGARGSQA